MPLKVPERVAMLLLLWGWIAARAVSVLECRGRVDFADVSQGVFSPLKKGSRLSSGALVRLQANAEIELASDSVRVNVAGPGKARLTWAAGARGASRELVLSEIEGTVSARADTGNPLRLFCGGMQIRRVAGVVNLVCRPDSSETLVWVDSGSAELAKDEMHVFLLEPGRIWKSKVVGDFPVETWLSPGQLVAQTTRAEVVLQWDGAAVAIPGSRWDADAAVRKTLGQIPGIAAESMGVASDWFLQGRIARFSVEDSGQKWSAHLIVWLRLKHRSYSFMNRELRYERRLVAEDSEKNRLKLLRLLPMDPENRKIRESILGELMIDLRDYVMREIMDPFRRGGLFQ